MWWRASDVGWILSRCHGAPVTPVSRCHEVTSVATQPFETSQIDEKEEDG